MKFLNIKKDKYVVIYCVREGKSYNFFKSRFIKPEIKKIKYDKDNEFIIDIENHTYRQGNTRFYVIDINSKQIYFEQLKNADYITSRITKKIMTDEVIMQLAKATTTPIKQTYDYKAIIIGLIIGGLIGAFIGLFIPIG